MKKGRRAAFLICVLLMAPFGAAVKKHAPTDASGKATPPEEALSRYIASVRAKQAAEA